MLHCGSGNRGLEGATRFRLSDRLHVIEKELGQECMRSDADPLGTVTGSAYVGNDTRQQHQAQAKTNQHEL